MAYDDNIQALLSAASIVRDETHEGGNTAARVGQLLVDMITSFDSAYKALSDSIPEGVDLSILKSYLSKEEAKTLFDTQSVFNRLFVEDTTNNAIKALKHLYSVSDITAFGYVKTELPSEGVGSFGELSEVLALGAQSGTKYWGWNGTDYAWLSAPAGGAVDLSEYPKRNEFAALTLKVNGLYEQYLPLGTSIGLDLDAVYAKKGEGGNVNLDDYYKKTEITTLLEGYVTNDTLVTTVKDVKAYTDAQISKLNISQYATKQALTDAINGANTTAQDYATQAYNNAVDYANGKFVTKAVNWEVIDGIKVLNGKYTFFKTLYIEPETSYGAYIGWQNGPAAMNILTNGRIKFRQGIQDNIELYGAKDAQSNNILPFFGFHFNDTVTDFSSRIIESAQGVLEIQDSTKLSGTLKIGNAYLTYDSDNNALFVKGKDGASVNLVATGDVAAYSGLGSGFDTLTDLTLTNKLTVKTIACSGNAVIDGELECTGEITTAYMSIDDVTIGSSITLDNDHIFMGLSNGAYIEFATNGRTSQLSDVWINNDKQVCITINGKEYKIATIQE